MQVLVNDFLSDPISLQRGVRQGDALSPLLYVLCVEVLACKIRATCDIKGFLLPGAGGRQFKVSQYADNTTIFVKDESSLFALFKVISIFESGSGAKLNRSKTEALWLGAWRDIDRTSHWASLGLRKQRFWVYTLGHQTLNVTTGKRESLSWINAFSVGRLELFH